MAFTQQQRARLAAAATALAAIAGITAIAFRADDFSPASDAVLRDGGMVRSTGATRVTDLLTAPVEPDATITTSVSLPAGALVTDIAHSQPSWTVVSQEHTQGPERVLYTITVRNDANQPRRFVAFITFDVPAPSDAGID